MKNDSPPWKEDPNNPTRKSSEKRKDKYGNEIKNVAKHLARKAMNSVKEAVNKKSRKKDWTGATIDKDRFVLPEEAEHENCGTPECCGQCDTAEVAEESGKSKQYIEITHVLGQKKRVPVHPLNAYKALNHYRNDPTTKSARIVSEEASNIIAKAKAAVAKKAGANLKMDPDTGTPDHFTAAQRRKKGLPEENDQWRGGTRSGGWSKSKETSNRKDFGRYTSSRRDHPKDVAGGKLAAARLRISNDWPSLGESKVYSVHVKGDSAQHNSPEFKKYLAGWGGEKHYTSDKGAAYKFKKEYQATGFHHGVGSMFKKLDSEHDGLVKEEIEQINEYGNDQNAHSVSAGYTPKTPPKTKPIAKPTMHPAAEKPRTPQSSVGSLSRIRGAMAKRLNNGTVKEELEEAYGMWKVDFPKQHAGKAVAAGSVHVKAQNTAHAHKVAAKRVGVDHKMFKSKVTKSSILPEELGKSNEWGRPELRKKFAAMTPGQEGLAAKNIPTFDARYDDVPTKYCGGIQKEETLSEISARGVAVRDDFRKKIQKAINDPANIARAKKVLAKKKAQQKVADANAPKNLVHQLHKSQSINAKVKFYDGKEHEIAPNHHDKFMNKYHGMKSSIEKEALVNRAHKSHDEFLKAIHEEWADFSQEKPNTDSINPANYPTPPIRDDMTDYNSDDRHDEYDAVAIENDVASEIENAEWEDLVDYYEDEDLDYQDSEEDIAEGITPQGRLKKRFNMMRTKGRRNLARNMALKRVATPDRIKSRSVRAARNMVYSRVLRGRDRSSLSASEKSRIEGMVKRMAPMVGRLSIRLQQKERMIDRKRINNRNKRKKK